MNFCLEYSKISPLSASKGYIREKRDVKNSKKDHTFYEMLPHRNNLSRTEVYTLGKVSSREQYLSIQICKYLKEVIFFLHF